MSPTITAAQRDALGEQIADRRLALEYSDVLRLVSEDREKGPPVAALLEAGADAS